MWFLICSSGAGPHQLGAADFGSAGPHCGPDKKTEMGALTRAFLPSISTPLTWRGLGRTVPDRGRVAEWLCRGLQILECRFDSGLGLQIPPLSGEVKNGKKNICRSL